MPNSRKWVKIIAANVLIAVALVAQNQLRIFDQRWSVPNTQDWKVASDQGAPMLQLLVGREPLPGPRRPFQFALADTPPFNRFTYEADMRPTKRSLIVVFAYQDASHFDYIHLSTDQASAQPVHNGVFHVFGGERVRISSLDGEAAFSQVGKWFHVRIEWNGETGEVQVLVDGRPIPALHAFDLSLSAGRVGVGSFDETGDFKNVKIHER